MWTRIRKDDSYERLLNSIDQHVLDEHVKALCRWNRLTGEKEAELAVDTIIDKLKEYGIPHERHQFEMYCSDPILGEIEVLTPEKYHIKAKARSFCLHCPDGMQGEIVYDASSQLQNLSPMEEKEWLRRMEGKIVLSWNYYEDYVQKIENAGAKGLIHIWPSPEEWIHEETVGPIWGTPTVENVHMLPKIPVVGVTYQDGMKLLAQSQNHSVMARVKTEVREGIKTVSLPIATIPGETEEYILLSGHYDSWHHGATDNAVGNALCLEVARVFARYAGQLKRGIKIAWWPGHSNARYAGSAWYCDQYWADLNEHCVAHINVDFPGTKGGVKVVPRSTGLEDRGFLQEIIAEFTDEKPDTFAFLPRGADQSFWGVNIPIHIGIKYVPLDETQIAAPGCAGGWWWHTEEDLYDKVDPDLLYRDTKIHAAILHELSQSEYLPVNLPRFIHNSKRIIEEIDQHSDEDFVFTPIYQALDALLEKWEGQEKRIRLGSRQYNALVKTVGGGLNRLMFSCSSRYDYDNTFPFKPFPGLHRVKGVYRENTPQEDYLFAKTFFVRQRNRFVNEIKDLMREMDYHLPTFRNG
jgi:aminopeptidase YwaD